MITTKKLPAPANLKSGNIASDYLIPNLHDLSSDKFIRLKNEKKERYGAMVFLGKPISSKNILDRYRENNELKIDEEKSLKILDEYLTLLQNFRIGNILSISCKEEGYLILEKIKERLPAESVRLPK
jgi:hypothetical protein